MSGLTKGNSRRHLFAAHGDSWKLKRCPICRWAVERDHAEALAMHTKRTPKPSHSLAGLAPERDAHEKPAVVDFVLV